MNKTSKYLPVHFLMLLILILGAFYLFSDSISEYPSYVHAWTQSDRLAIAMNFQKNGFDLFHPATYNLLTKDGITQVDFPIHEFFVAGISQLFSSDIITTFRSYNLVYTLIGLYFLFLAFLKLTDSPKRAVFGVTFIATLPFYVYYQNGFLPSTTSLANLFIGLYFLISFYQKKEFKKLLIGGLFLTLAALSRTPFAIFLFAAFCERSWSYVFKKSSVQLKELLLFIPFFALVVAYYLYNQHLASTYGSMFLSELLSIDSWETFLEVVWVIYDRWSNQILSPFHLLVLLIFLLLIIKTKKPDSDSYNSLHLLFLFAGLGVMTFFYAFGQQFADHDYYYLDSFLPLFVIALALLLARIKIPQNYYTPIALLCLGFVFYFYGYANRIQMERYTPPWNDRVDYAYQVYLNSKNDMRTWGVNEEDTLVILNAVSTNIPFTVWGNQGYTVLNSGKDSTESALSKKHDYVILSDSNFRMDSWVDYPEITKRLDLVASNGLISAYKISEDQDRSNFFENLIYYGESDFDKIMNLDSTAIEWMQTKEVDHQHGKSYYAPKEYEFFLSSKYTIEKNLSKDIEVMVLADYYLPSDTSRMQLVVSHGDYYHAQFLESQIKVLRGWKRHLYRFTIPKEKINANIPIALYYWNPQKNEIVIDNLKIMMYQ